MPSGVDRAYLEALAHRTYFNRDLLEKVLRLVVILKDITQDSLLKDFLCLKGGTALQLVHLGLRRLSVDIDFNYVGGITRQEMEANRELIDKRLGRIFLEHGYTFSAHSRTHALDQCILGYQNAVGNADKIKIEINYSERVPVLPIRERKLVHPFDIVGPIKALTYKFDELAAMKTRALLTRATPRDLFDVFLIAEAAKDLGLDIGLYRKVALFYLCLVPGDVRRLTIDRVSSLEEKSARRFLIPIMRKSDRPPLIEVMKDKALDLVAPILKFDKGSRGFLDRYYDEGIFDKRMLFGQHRVSRDLERHPMVLWRLQRRKDDAIS